MIVVYSKGWVWEGDMPPPTQCTKLKVSFLHVVDTRLPVHYNMYLVEGNIRKMLLLINYSVVLSAARSVKLKVIYRLKITKVPLWTA